MTMWMLLGELMRARTREYLSCSPLEPTTMPGLRAPATQAQIDRLKAFAGQPLDPEYRSFLSLTDGFDGFQLSMPLLGCRDWEDPELSGWATAFRDIMADDPLAESGLPEGTRVFPMYVDCGGSAGVLMLHHGDDTLERFWWTGEGDSMVFHTFSDVVAHLTDGSYSPRHLG
ncbi:SMI1/KNR4 family protein [Streptomyces sp. NBC_01218]|uniref:SMI1/KNR4 family protein n=1 Tax=Streptomyces sp. NBC_01218 TaxID=2903780 RepID=UPI002E113A38|nr:SMI1/KNR4 family protein [Streptomyces sp. NBC_01218]